MKRFLTCACTVVMLSGMAPSPEQDLTRYVNTLQGTNSKHELTRGNTYPTTALPWGMNFWTPQTGPNRSGWIYQYFKDSIRGFRQTHQCSSWTRDYAAFSLMPVSGALEINQYRRAAKFSHDNETAKPHYYKVAFDNGVVTEMSPTERGVHMRFSFPRSGDAYVVLDASNGGSRVMIIPEERKIIGYARNANRSVPEGFANYFVAVFDKPFEAYGTWKEPGSAIAPGNKEAEDDYVGAYIQFKKGTKVQAKVTSSYISYAQAELTLQQELGKFSAVEQTSRAAREIWNEHLNKIQVEGGTEEQKATFYSCFFRSMLFPRKFYEHDADGRPVYYSPYDGKIHEGYMYTDNGFWDTFRAQFPLNAILHPEFHGRYITSLITAYDQSNWLPSWSFPGHSGGMIGNHALSLIADAWAKGFRDYDSKQAMKAMFHEATNKGPGGPANGRDGWKDYFTYGYVSYPDYHESTAKTLEYCYNDWCAMQFASMTGQPFYEELFKRQIFNYKNVFDPAVGFMRGRQNDGSWYPGFDPAEWGGPFTEGCAWHYLWSVFHDIQGLVNLLGGDKAFVAKLDSVFAASSDFKVGTYNRVIHEMAEMAMINMGQYAHGNQPIQHMIYLYNYAGEPWKTQKWVRRVMDELYASTPDGYPGDEDQGQTSSWYVISAMGLYSVCPGTTEYVIGSPLFPKMTIALENGKKLIIEAQNNTPENVYIQSASLNGKPFTRNFLHYSELMNGGVIRYQMGSTPAFHRGTAKEDRPFSVSKPKGGNPIFEGWYADPEGVIYDNTYWIYPTYSDVYERQVFFDCFSSDDMVHWTKHARILDTAGVRWAKRAMWAPSVIRKDGRYYLFFSANDVHEGETGGIGVAVSDSPEGPYKDLLGKPLINDIVNGAQPIDQFIFHDDDGSWYLYYGGWRHCNIVRLNNDFTALIPHSDGTIYKEITPENYVEGPFMLKKDGKYYFMWSEGGWTGPDYSVAYAISDSPFGPFRREGKILEQDATIASGAGHHSVIHPAGADDYYIVYHRRPLGETHANHRVTCIDRLFFDENGRIKPVKITSEGITK